MTMAQLNPCTLHPEAAPMPEVVFGGRPRVNCGNLTCGRSVYGNTSDEAIAMWNAANPIRLKKGTCRAKKA